MQSETQVNVSSDTKHVQNKDMCCELNEDDTKMINVLKQFEAVILQEKLNETLQINEHATKASTAMSEILSHKNNIIATLQAENATKQHELNYALETIHALTQQLAITDIKQNNTEFNNNNNNSSSNDSNSNVEESTKNNAAPWLTFNSDNVAKLYSEHILLQNQLTQYEEQETHWREMLQNINSTMQEIAKENITLRRQIMQYQSTCVPMEKYMNVVKERNVFEEQWRTAQLRLKEVIINAEAAWNNLEELSQEEQEYEEEECESDNNNNNVNNEHDQHQDKKEEEHNEVLTEKNEASSSSNSKEANASSNDDNNKEDAHVQTDKQSDVEEEELLYLPEEEQEEQQQQQQDQKKTHSRSSESNMMRGEMWDAALVELEERANALVDYQDMVAKLKVAEEELALTCNMNAQLSHEMTEIRKVNVCLRADKEVLHFRNNVFEEQVVSLLGKVHALCNSYNNLTNVNNTLKQSLCNAEKELEELYKREPLLVKEFMQTNKHNGSKLIGNSISRRDKRYEQQRSGRVSGFGLRATTTTTKTARAQEEDVETKSSHPIPSEMLLAPQKQSDDSGAMGMKPHELLTNTANSSLPMHRTLRVASLGLCFPTCSEETTNKAINASNTAHGSKPNTEELLLDTNTTTTSSSTLSGAAYKKPNAAEMTYMHGILQKHTREQNKEYNENKNESCASINENNHFTLLEQQEQQQQERQQELFWRSLQAHDELAPFAVNSIQELVQRNQELVHQLYLLSHKEPLTKSENKTLLKGRVTRKGQHLREQENSSSQTSSHDVESNAALSVSSSLLQRKRRRVEDHVVNSNDYSRDNISDEDEDDDISHDHNDTDDQVSESLPSMSESELEVESMEETANEEQTNNNNANTSRKEQGQANKTNTNSDKKIETENILSHDVQTIVRGIVENVLEANNASTSESKTKFYISLLDVIENKSEISSNNNNTNSTTTESEETHQEQLPFRTAHGADTIYSFIAQFVKPLMTLCTNQAIALGRQECELLEQKERDTTNDTTAWERAQNMLTAAMEQMKLLIELSSHQLIVEFNARTNNNNSNNGNGSNSNNSSNNTIARMLNTSEMEMIEQLCSLLRLASRKESNMSELQQIAYDRHERWMSEKVNKLARIAAIALKYNNNNNNNSNSNNNNNNDDNAKGVNQETDLQEIEEVLFTDLTQRLILAQREVASLHNELSAEKHKYTSMYEQMWELELTASDAINCKTNMQRELERMIAPETLQEVKEQVASLQTSVVEHQNTITRLMEEQRTLMLERSNLQSIIQQNEGEFQVALRELDREVQHLRRIRSGVENRNAELQSSRLEDLATIHKLQEQLANVEKASEELKMQLAEQEHKLVLSKTVFMSTREAQEALTQLYPDNTALQSHAKVIDYLQEQVERLTAALDYLQQVRNEQKVQIKTQAEELEELKQRKEEVEVQLLKYKQNSGIHAVLAKDDKHLDSSEPLSVSAISSSSNNNNNETNNIVSTNMNITKDETLSSLYSSSSSVAAAAAAAAQLSSSNITLQANNFDETTEITVNALRLQLRDLSALLKSTETERDKLQKSQEEWNQREEKLRAELEVLGNDPVSATAKKYGLQSIQNFEEQIAEMYNRNEELINAHAQLTARCDKLEEDVAKQLHLNDMLTQERNKLERDAHIAHEEITQLQHALSDAEKSNVELTDKLQLCESTIEADEETINRIRDDCDALHNEIEKWNDKFVKSENEREKYVHDNVELLNKLSEMQSVLQTTENEHKKVTESFEKERDELHSQIEELHQSLTEAKASHSSTLTPSSSSMLFARAQARARPPISLTANMNPVNANSTSPTSTSNVNNNNIAWQSSVFSRH